MSGWDELRAIADIRDQVSSKDVGTADCATIRGGEGESVALSTDRISERQRYPGESLTSLCRRGLTEAVSDLAATGATFVGVQIDVAAPADFSAANFAEVGSAIDSQLRAWGGRLLNGSNLVLGTFDMSTTAVGVVSGRPLDRLGAADGDVIALSGSIGGWNAATAIFNTGLAERLAPRDLAVVFDAFVNYQPELAYGRILQQSGAISSCLDCNDCLWKSASDLAAASEKRFDIDSDSVPVHPAIRHAVRLTGCSGWDLAAGGVAGDDRLLFTLRPESVPALSAALARLGRQVHIVGRVRNGEGVHATRYVDPLATQAVIPAGYYTREFAVPDLCTQTSVPRVLAHGGGHALLCCPIDQGELIGGVDVLRCADCGRGYPVVEGIPDFVIDD